MRRARRLIFAAVAAAALSAGVAACGSDDEGGGGESSILIHGTTDQPVSYDPAGSYDLPSYNVIFNVYQNLMQVPPGGNKPEPEAAESCDFTDQNNQVYECKLQSGLKFSDGSDFTSEDVKASFDRNLKIADPQGASSLYLNLKNIETPDDTTVVFNLKAPDATWPFLLTTGGAAIAPAEYPADKVQPSDEVVGSGRYQVESYEPGQQTVLEANPEYTGDDPAQVDQVVIQYYDKSSTLKQAVEQGEVDLAYRSLSPTDISDLEGADGVEVYQEPGVEIRYMNFNLDLQEGSDAQKKAVRQAVAQTIDRASIAENVYNGTADPLYSMVPSGLQFHTEAFADRYGDQPDPDAAKKTLAKAGVDTPIPLEVWWTPSHYGPVSGDEYAEIKRQLDDSGLFEVTLKSTEWNQYSEAAFTDKYPVYQLGWFPDYPDADNYTSSFYSKDSFLNIHYSNPEMEKLLAEEKANTDESAREQAFAKIQEIGAEDAPTIPYIEISQVAVAGDAVSGVEDTLDPSYIFRYWLISKD
ncbi:MAG TPA: ABC transporter substrate-binding protein [Candidatus Limnocylindrales bacterium]|nr:ABC transporter substrate-binding protein [Candidatus Limnocylindrales bacterium]